MTADGSAAADAPARPPSTTAATRLLAVLGHPVQHSLSPQLHSAAIAAVGLDAVYLAFDILPEAFGRALTGLLDAGLMGANITIPHKHAALAFADAATEEAAAIGAANTLFRTADGTLTADNTDAAGLRGVLVEDCRVRAATPVTLFGTGGAARAAAVALGRLGAAVTVRGRRPQAADAIAQLARDSGGAAPSSAKADVVVNATPLGRHGERLPADLMTLGRGQVALDLNYGPPSPFLQEAAARGATAVDGLAMLVGQAEAAFGRWTGAPPPEGVMAAAARRATT